LSRIASFVDGYPPPAMRSLRTITKLLMAALHVYIVASLWR